MKLESVGNTFSKIKGGIKKKKFTKKTLIIAAAVLAAVIALVTVLVIKAKSGSEGTEQSYTTAYAMVGDVTETIQQSGTVEPYERREITSLVKGEIIESSFEEGDYVEEGQTLYRIDDEDAQLNIEKSVISLEETEEDIKNLYIYAPAGGTLSDFDLKEGESAKTGVIGYITDNDTLTADIPFTSADYNKINVGDNVTVTSALYMTSLPGTVTHKYDGILNSSNDGSAVKNIEVEISNPGALATGTTVAAVVSTSSGEVYSTGSGTLESGGNVSVNCEVQGTVSTVNVKSGDKVKKGQLLAVLENRSLYTTKKSNELNLRSSQKTLENYNITAPISGTIITKNSKLGDKIDNSNSSTVMMVIADMSKMKFTISVDELDIAKIQIDQKVIVDADAIEDRSFEGRVTSVAAEGVSSGDGVTTYEVEIVIDDPGELKSGMNVNANIIINEATEVVYIPEEALMMARGTSASVLVKSDGSAKKSESNAQTGDMTEKAAGGSSEGMPEGINGEMPARPEGENAENMPEKPEGENTGKMPQGTGSEAPQGDGGAAGQMPAGGNGGGAASRMGMNLPEGYELRQVVTGVSDGTNVEIVSGLSEGEEIIYIPTTASSESGFMMGRMPGMGGGMPGGMGGGMPGGGNRQGGGMPGGGMRR